MTPLIFAEWCLQREMPRWLPSVYRMSFLIPALLAWLEMAVIWPDLKHPGAGREAVQHLLWFAAAVVLVGGVQFAAKAVCWELSLEMRDIVRLTGLDAKLLLWSKTLACWWTIAWSLLLMLPLVPFARTLGGVMIDQLLVGLHGLLLLAALTAGFGMLASVLTAGTKNPEKMAASATSLGLLIYNLSFVFLSLSLFWGTWLITGAVSPELKLVFSRIALCAPAVSVTNALRSPFLFTPSAPAYWMHYLTAIACAALATLVIEFRSRSSVSSMEAETADERPSFQPSKMKLEVSASSTSGVEQQMVLDSASVHSPQHAAIKVRSNSGGRPRCSDQPFLWKDIYVLSDERKRINPWTLCYLAATIGLILLGVISTDIADRYRLMGLAIPCIVVTAVLLSIRFDALLTAEFRDRTWGSLMLLPIDPCDLLQTKLCATLWEQRFGILPVGVAFLAQTLIGPGDAVVALGMTSAIALIASGLLCQMSCINQLLGKAWWVGLCQTIGFITVIVIAFAIWLNCGLWLGFVLTSLFLAIVLGLVQYGCVNRLARGWVEL